MKQNKTKNWTQRSREQTGNGQRQGWGGGWEKWVKEVKMLKKKEKEKANTETL